MRTSAPKDPHEIRIADHFNGPPGMGQGGYSAGLLAQQFQGPVRVTLRKPIPLERDLQITHSQDGKAVLLDGEVVIAEAEPATLNFETLPAPGWEAAVRAAASYPGFTLHPYPTCFCCGHLRGEGDGLRIFPAPLGERQPWAAPWEPYSSLGDEEGIIPAEIIWAALDCPSGWSAVSLRGSALPEGGLLVTGQLSVEIMTPVHTDRRYITQGWVMEVQGRKITTASALYDDRGQCVARGQALWIVITPK
ncbi:MAG: hypothetical protein OEW39_11690 [Deltaproteobacteria bacterium]|nr:hypothetical protein [Deltaproteobacteria bacterium]